MKTLAASLLVMAVLVAGLAIPASSLAQPVVISDTVNTTVTLTSTTFPFGTFVLPAGTTITPPLTDPLPVFLTPNLFDFSAFFAAFMF